MLRRQIVTTNRRHLGERDDLVMHAELNLGNSFAFADWSGLMKHGRR